MINFGLVEDVAYGWINQQIAGIIADRAKLRELAEQLVSEDLTLDQAENFLARVLESCTFSRYDD
jgi:hypothetical protein